MTQRRILVTGATGGLGLAIVREARARGAIVRATGRSLSAQARLAQEGAEFVRFDLEDTARDPSTLVEGCDSVIHAAALSASWGPIADFVSANVTATARLLDAATKTGVNRFVFISSPSIFARFEDQESIGEDALPNPAPLNHYAGTKLAAERLVLKSAAHDFACCAIRPRALVGEGDRVILPRLAELARRPRIPLPRGGQALIELTDMRDAAWAICEAEARATNNASAISGKAINISGGQPIKVGDLALQLADALGTAPRLVPIPLGLARPIACGLEHLAALARSTREPVLTRYTLATMGYSQTFDPEPARRLLGYTPSHDALQTLIEQARSLASMEHHS